MTLKRNQVEKLRQGKRLGKKFTSVVTALALCTMVGAPAFAMSRTPVVYQEKSHAPLQKLSTVLHVPVTINGQQMTVEIQTKANEQWHDGTMNVVGLVHMDGMVVSLSGIELGLNHVTGKEGVLRLLGERYVSHVFAHARADSTPVGVKDAMSCTLTNAMGDSMSLPRGAHVSYVVRPPEHVNRLDYSMADDEFLAKIAGIYRITPVVTEFGEHIYGAPIAITVTSVSTSSVHITHHVPSTKGISHGTSTPTVPSSTPVSFLSGDGQPVPSVALQNAATSDQIDWTRASNSLYLLAQTGNPANSKVQGNAMISVLPGQPLYLAAYSQSGNVTNRETTWSVNSPDATMTPIEGQLFGGNNGNQQMAGEQLIVSKPGVYTIQADDQGTYSVPLVITVGQSKLASVPFSESAVQMGVLPLPSTLAPLPAVQSTGLSYTPYPAQGTWIPISGTVQGTAQTVTAVLLSASQEWSYRLPVGANGAFSGYVESPFTGPVTVDLIPGFLAALTQNQGSLPSSDYSYEYDVNPTGTSLTSTQSGLLSSTTMDNNMNPPYKAIADALLENAPTLNTGIEAISNYVSDLVVYNYNELKPNQYVWQDAITTFDKQSGVCENYAQLTAAMLREVGIPAETIGGYGNATWTTPNYSDTNPQDAHEWVQAWNGSAWILLDPTWADGNQVVNNVLTNQFFTDTISFADTHAGISDQIGTDFSAFQKRKGNVHASV